MQRGLAGKGTPACGCPPCGARPGVMQTWCCPTRLATGLQPTCSPHGHGHPPREGPSAQEIVLGEGTAIFALLRLARVRRRRGRAKAWELRGLPLRVGTPGGERGGEIGGVIGWLLVGLGLVGEIERRWPPALAGRLQ